MKEKEKTENPAGVAGTLSLDGELEVRRLGFGAMRITGDGIWGPPKNPDSALRILRRAVELGVNFIDTADSYGPYLSEELIAKALAPYPPDLVIATEGGWNRPGPDQWTLAGVLAAYGASSDYASAADKKYTIALIPGVTTDAFYITMHKGAQAAANALGVDLILQGAPEFDAVQQVPVLNAIIGRKVDAILIAPTDKVQLVSPLKKALDSGIPVLTVDLSVGNGHYQTGSGDADFPLSNVASDNILEGEIAAKAIGDKGEVYVSNVKPNISAADQREQGFKEEMKKHPNITVLETQYNDDDSNKAAAQFQSVYARNSDLAGVFAANLFSATGAANGIKQANAKGKIKVAAFDAPQSIVADIKAGNIDIAIAQHPAEIGFYGVVTAYAHLTGQSVPPLIETGLTVIDRGNVDDQNVKKFIYSE